MPGFYHRPKKVEDLVDFVVGKVLDLLQIPHDLYNLREKVEAGVRLTREEGLEAMTSFDLLTLGTLADTARKRISGDYVYFTSNVNINYSNICWVDCDFCAFSRLPGQDGAYQLSVEQVAERADKPWVNEVHIVGGLHPRLPITYYEEILKEIKRRRPDIYVQAFTAVEVDYFSKMSRLPVGEVLSRLSRAGLDGMPGGGAEILSERVRRELCPRKISSERWLEVIRIAHDRGIRTNATMLYGHIETAEERISHLLALRELQDRTFGFKSLVPLAFHHKNTNLARPHPTDGLDDLRVLAVSRLMLDNFPHIKALWTYIGPKMAQIALHFGADDLGGTLLEEKVVHEAGARTPSGLSRDYLERMIREAGRIPVHTNSSYQIPKDLVA
ncbi:MAG: aminofutalosine synthase MqnE [Armatimonadetes bacterium]|nr:aminofutalosine synthase MqnE [Armatimonadota bacterium]